MFLSRVIFKRGRQRAILQGMIHIGPNALYELLQYDIDWAQSNGYQVFFEGIKKEPFSSLRTANELKIRNFFNLLFEYYPVFSESFGLSLQQKNILLPEDAINADIGFNEFIVLLDRNNFRCNFLTWLLGENMKIRVVPIFQKDEGFRFLIQKSKERSWMKLFRLFLLRNAMPIILGHRNRVAVDRIHQDSRLKRDIFIQYGESHVPGIRGLMKRNGWVVSKTDYLDLVQFC